MKVVVARFVERYTMVNNYTLGVRKHCRAVTAAGPRRGAKGGLATID